MIHLYVNIADGSLIKSLSSIAIAPAPSFVAGDEGREVVLHFVTIANADAFTPVVTEQDWSAYAVELGIGVIGAAPTAGSFPLAFDANTASGIGCNATAAQVAAALNTLASVTAAGGVAVSSDNPGGPFAIAFLANGARDLLASPNNSLYPDSDVQIQRAQPGGSDAPEIQTVTLARRPFAFCDSWTPYAGGGLYGLLDLSALAQIQDLAGGNKTLTCTLEIKAAPPGGNVETISQAQVKVLMPLMPVNAVGPAASASYLTTAQSRLAFVWNRSDITSLTGGGASDLHSVLTAALPLSILIQTASNGALYVLRTGTDAESLPTIIRPTDFNATSNPRVWQLETSSGAGNVVGPATAPADGEIAVFDGTSGTLLKSGGGTISALVSSIQTWVSGQISAAVTALGLGTAATHAAGDFDAAGAAAAVTKTSIGLGNVTNDSQVKRSEMGANSGVATLGDDGLLSASQRPAAGGVTALAEAVADSTVRLALTGKPLGFWALQQDNYHIYELIDLSNIANEGGWADLGALLPYAPVMTSAPTLPSGSPTVGTAFTATTGVAAGRPTPTLAWKWQTSTDSGSTWSDISGATSAGYTPVSGDVGNLLRVGQQASNALGSSDWSFSDASAAVASNVTLALFCVVQTSSDGSYATFTENGGGSATDSQFTGLNPGDPIAFWNGVALLGQTTVDHIGVDPTDGVIPAVFFNPDTSVTSSGIQMWSPA